MAAFRVFIAGAGRQSAAAGVDLLRFGCEVELTLADASLRQAESTAERIRSIVPGPHIKCIECDIELAGSAAAAMADHDVVLAGVPYHLNPSAHLAARKTGLPSVDMGSDLSDLEETLGSRGSEQATAVVFDAGLAPGLGNQLARHLVEQMPSTEEVRIYCGGLPFEPRTQFRYRPRFSLEGLIGEYSDPAYVLKDGKQAVIESLSELEAIEVPGLGKLEAFVTSGGSSIAPMLFEGQLKSYEYKTLRFPGHFAAMRAYRDLGMWSHEAVNFGSAQAKPFDLFEKLFTAATRDEDSRDQVVLLVEARSKDESRRLFVRSIYDSESGLSAMEQLTGYCASIVLLKMFELHLKPGLYAAEEIVSGREMIEELAKRKIAVEALT